jgi:hypothetical protein
MDYTISLRTHNAEEGTCIIDVNGHPIGWEYPYEEVECIREWLQNHLEELLKVVNNG